MLRERAFQMGGILSIVAGLALLALDLLNPSPFSLGLGLSGGLLAAFGAFYWYVGAGARRERQDLLAQARPPP
jgi:hypothetical protein